MAEVNPEVQEFMKSSIVTDYTKDIQQYNLGPLWEAIPAIMHKTPTPQAEAYLWSDELIKKKMAEAAKSSHQSVVVNVVRFISKILA